MLLRELANEKHGRCSPKTESDILGGSCGSFMQRWSGEKGYL